ncbi:hypothetical protein [Devosia salina]|uniref:Uncharacterized protein n=1 Tax=Devosia salina TaxID=2860336 RepID=A0ABX8W9E3_9HYPH|nr:hypothetical protein [Devosia salina]QYO75327.1 hypothetical protein K1X15_11765 [Devosia salina]
MQSLLSAVVAGRHDDLGPYRSALAWFAHAIEIDPTPLGAANDNTTTPKVRDTKLADDGGYARELLRALPEPDGHDQEGFPIWTPPLPPISEWGKLKFATRAYQDVQFVMVKGELEARNFRVPKGALTHVWGRKLEQETGRTRQSEAEFEVKARQTTLDWLCQMLGAIPSGNPKKSMRRRPKQPPIDRQAFAHLRGGTLAEARAAVGLPHADPLPAGLPYGPQPERLFSGLLAGRGSRVDGMGESSRVRRSDPETYTVEEAALDRITVDQFQATEPDHFNILMGAAAVRSMSALVPANDNKMGKRRLTAAALALQEFLAA